MFFIDNLGRTKKKQVKPETAKSVLNFSASTPRQEEQRERRRELKRVSEVERRTGKKRKKQRKEEKEEAITPEEKRRRGEEKEEILKATLNRNYNIQRVKVIINKKFK